MRRKVLVNLVIGFALLFVLRSPWVQRNQTVMAARNAIITWQMARLIGLDTGSGLAWIDIDETAHQAWGLPFSTRRDKLADLIAFALRGSPTAVVVDVDLTVPTLGLTRYDMVLQNFLGRHVNSCRNCPPILLVRTFAPSEAYNYAGQPGPALRAQRSFLDPVLGTSPDRPWSRGGVIWGSAGIDRDEDFVVRRWRLWEDSCTSGGAPVVTPSIMLLAAAMASGDSLTQTKTQTQQALQPHAQRCVPRSAVGSAQPSARVVTQLTIGKAKTTITLTEDAIARRLFYRIPWSQTHDRQTLVPLPADYITKHPNADASILNGKIVVIGASNEASGDLRLTPVGAMPGSLVMINAINSLMRGDQIHEASLAVTIGIEAGLILLVSYLFAAFSASAALLISLGLIVLGSLTLGFYAFNSGVWIDSVVPLGGVILHEMLARMHHHATRIARRVFG